MDCRAGGPPYGGQPDGASLFLVYHCPLLFDLAYPLCGCASFYVHVHRQPRSQPGSSLCFTVVIAG